MKPILIIPIAFGAVVLSACNTTRSTVQTVAYESYSYDDMQYFPQTDDANPSNFYHYQVGSPMPIDPADSYHVGEGRSPVPSRDRDSQWVISQKPQNYTIQIAAGAKASEVALKLLKAPKSQRMAEIRSNARGGAYYQGLYGSYSSYGEAEKALNSLPDDLRSGASIKTFGLVQGALN